jgi:hypothetical protein
MLPAVGDVAGHGGEEVQRVKDLEVAVWPLDHLGLVDHSLCGGVVADLVHREWGADQVAGQILTADGVIGADAHLSVHAEPGMRPGFHQLDALGGQQPLASEHPEDPLPKEPLDWRQDHRRQRMEDPVRREVHAENRVQNADRSPHATRYQRVACHRAKEAAVRLFLRGSTSVKGFPCRGQKSPPPVSREEGSVSFVRGQI